MIDARRFAIASHAAARSAGHAVAAAHVARHAFAASTYAVSAIRDSSTSDNEMVLIDKERQWQYKHLLELQMSNNITNNSL